jgi:hypothetical protein
MPHLFDKSPRDVAREPRMGDMWEAGKRPRCRGQHPRFIMVGMVDHDFVYFPGDPLRPYLHRIDFVAVTRYWTYYGRDESSFGECEPRPNSCHPLPNLRALDAWKKHVLDDRETSV